MTAAPSLTLVKSLASGTGVPGAILVFGLKITNNGNQDSAATALQETIPPNTTFNAAQSSSGWSCAGTSPGSACALSLPGIPGAGGTFARAFAVTIANPLPAGVTMIANTACDGDTCDSIQIPTDGQSRLSATKSVVSGTPTPGSTLVFGFTVRNLGNQGALVNLTETVPAHTSFISAASSAWTCSGTAAGSTCSLDAGKLAGGATSTTYLFAVAIDNPLPSGAILISNTACASTPSGQTSCDQVELPADASPRLLIDKTRTSAPPAPGQLATYAIAISNSGNQDAAAVTLTEQVPAATTSTQRAPIRPGRAAPAPALWCFQAFPPAPPRLAPFPSALPIPCRAALPRSPTRPAAPMSRAAMSAQPSPTRREALPS